MKCCGKCWLALGWRDVSYDACRQCTPRIPYASTTQARVSPLASGASKGVEQGRSLSPLLYGLYLDALEGHLDDKEYDAPTLADLHVWLLLFVDDLALMSELEVGL